MRRGDEDELRNFKHWYYEHCLPATPLDAHVILYSFVREVEKRVGQNTGEIYTADAFYDLVREFNLGGK